MPQLSPQQFSEYSDKLDGIRKRHFLAAGAAGDLKVEQFVPATGIGKFDAVYSPAQNRLDINIPTRFWFQEKIGTGTTESEVPWTKLEQLRFIHKSVELAKAWGGQYQLTCAKPGWLNFHATVHINLNPVGHGKEYYIVKVRKLAKPKSSGGIDHGQAPHVCGVNNWACEVDQSKQVDQIFNFKEGLIRNRLRESKTDRSGDVIEFASNSTTLSTDERLRLAMFTTYANQQRTEELAGIKAFVVGVTGKKDSFMARNLSRDRTAAVVAMLNHGMRGGDFAQAASADEPWAKEALAVVRARARHFGNSFGGVLVVIRTPGDVARVVPHRYIVMKHEIGHMLGLPDEYMGVHSDMTVSKLQLDAVVPATYFAASAQTGNDRLRKMQEGLVRDLQTANVAAPTFMSTTGNADAERSALHATRMDAYYAERSAARKKLGDGAKYDAWKERHPEPVSPTPLTTVSSSIMHSGDEILPAHYVTIWSALSQMTAGYVDPDQWKIVPV